MNEHLIQMALGGDLERLIRIREAAQLIQNGALNEELRKAPFKLDEERIPVTLAWLLVDRYGEDTRHWLSVIESVQRPPVEPQSPPTAPAVSVQINTQQSVPQSTSKSASEIVNAALAKKAKQALTRTINPTAPETQGSKDAFSEVLPKWAGNLASSFAASEAAAEAQTQAVASEEEATQAVQESALSAPQFSAPAPQIKAPEPKAPENKTAATPARPVFTPSTGQAARASTALKAKVNAGDEPSEWRSDDPRWGSIRIGVTPAREITGQSSSHLIRSTRLRRAHLLKRALELNPQHPQLAGLDDATLISQLRSSSSGNWTENRARSLLRQILGIEEAESPKAKGPRSVPVAAQSDAAESSQNRAADTNKNVGQPSSMLSAKAEINLPGIKTPQVTRQKIQALNILSERLKNAPEPDKLISKLQQKIDPSVFEIITKFSDSTIKHLIGHPHQLPSDELITQSSQTIHEVIKELEDERLAPKSVNTTNAPQEDEREETPAAKVSSNRTQEEIAALLTELRSAREDVNAELVDLIGGEASEHNNLWNKSAAQLPDNAELLTALQLIAEEHRVAREAAEAAQEEARAAKKLRSRKLNTTEQIENVAGYVRRNGHPVENRPGIMRASFSNVSRALDMSQTILRDLLNKPEAASEVTLNDTHIFVKR